MLFNGYCNRKELCDPNEELAKLEGYLDDDIAKTSLAQFLRANLGWTVEYATGKTLFPFQEMLIRGMFNKDFFLAIAGRGLSKTFTASMFCWLYALFNPGVKIGILAPSFRQSRIMFENIETFANSKGGEVLRQCFTKEPSHKNEIWSMEIGRSTIVALPLGEGGKLRGFRFNVVLVDELLLMPEKVINEVILPFLSVNFDPMKRKMVTEEEDLLIEQGLMLEEDRTTFSNPKFIGLTSASYKFEFLYKLYKEYVDKIYDQNPKDEQGKVMDTSGYGVMQLSWRVAPKHLYNEEAILKFQAQMSEVQFNREFNSVFTDDSGGFFSKRKMDLCTVENGQEPTIELKGNPSSEYILAIDPSWSKAESSDHFAMCVLKIDKENNQTFVVHNYAMAGGEFQGHLNYLTYLLKSFKIVYIIIDNAGKWFLEDANASVTFKENKLHLEFFEQDFENDNYLEGVRRSRRSYNREANRICHAQYFSQEWITKSNERLAASFDHRTVKFASHPMDSKFKALMEEEIPVDNLVFDTESRTLTGSARKAAFIEHQGEMIGLVKSETSLIEVKTSDNGRLTFTLPSAIKKDTTSPTRARRDSYSALLLGSWAFKCYKDMMDEPKEDISFIPFFAAF